MLYCQHVLGIGHFFRSMAIASALEGHDVLFVEGGEPLQGFDPPAHVKRLFLPPLMMDPEFDHLEARSVDLDDVKAARKELLLEAFETFAPHVLLTELFPFGRNQFRFELIPLLEGIRAEKRPTRVLCSLRDILVEKPDQAAYEERVISRLNDFYDAVLVHSDPRVFSLQDTFSRVAAIRPPIHYTGYVARDAPVKHPHTDSSLQPSGHHPVGLSPAHSPLDGGRGVSCRGRSYGHSETPPYPRQGGDADKGFCPDTLEAPSPERTIVVSAGGGRVGVDLLSACIRAMRHLADPDLRMSLYLGPFIEEKDRSDLEALAAQDRRTSLRPFAPHFAAELRRAALSISMAGYNTCMDLLAAHTRALVYPFPQNREQAMRAAKLEGLGLVRMLKNLAPDALCDAIMAALSDPSEPGSAPIDLNGAETSARLVEQYGNTLGESGASTITPWADG